MSKLQQRFNEGWWQKLSPFFASKAFAGIKETLKNEIMLGKRITPNFDDTYRAFKECPYDKLKVVILGLDPYPGVNATIDRQLIADGIAFSARYNLIDPPVSLRYIFSAIEKDCYGGFGIGFNEEYEHPDLTRWANQGVLCINQALSTVVGKTGEHLLLWKPFIKYVFQVLAQYNTGLVFILLGSKAKEWRGFINEGANYVLTATHPASCAYKGLKEWDCNKVFSQCNEILEKDGQTKILW